MIEQHIRQFFPVHDTSRISDIRRSSEPGIRDAVFWEYGLDPLLPFVSDPKTIDSDISEFLRLRGTLTAVRMAMKWVGFPAITFVRLSSYEYEIDPGRLPDQRELAAIRAALSVSMQARGQLMRIFHGDFEVRYG